MLTQSSKRLTWAGQIEGDLRCVCKDAEQRANAASKFAMASNNGFLL